MASDVEALVADMLEPLGGPFRKRYWPISGRQVAEIEATIGWSLPDDYRSFIMTAGIARPSRRLAYSPSTLDYEIFLTVLYGNDPEDDNLYSIVAQASRFLEPEPLLQIGLTEGGALYLDQAGAIGHESNTAMGVPVIAASFTGYLSGMHPPAD